MVLNDEMCPCFSDEPFDEIDSKPRQSILVGNHNFFDMSLFEVDQKPREAFPFVLESRADVLVDFVTRVRLLHRSDLSLEVVLLFTRGHSTVDGTGSGFLFRVLFGSLEVVNGTDGGDMLGVPGDEIVDVIPPLSTCRSCILEPACISPGTNGSCTHSKGPGYL